MWYYVFLLPVQLWYNRKALGSPERYHAFVRKAAGEAKPPPASTYPEGPDGGWRYEFKRLPRHDELLERYGLDEIAGQGTAFERALRVMKWLTAHTYYSGMSVWSCRLPDDGLKILRYAYDGPFRKSINCRHKAIALADCLMALGIFALPIWLVRDGACHVITHVWLPEESRWVMLDPSLDSYIADEAGRVLHLIEIYERHRKGKALHVAQYNLNGTQDCREVYLNSFLLGCLLEIEVYDGTDSRRNDPRNRLVPEGVEPRDAKTRVITTAELLAGAEKL